MKPGCTGRHFIDDVETLVNLEKAGMNVIGPSRVIMKRIKVRRTGREESSLETTLPMEVFERQARLRDLPPEELVIDLRTNITSTDLRIRDIVFDLMTTNYPLPPSHTRGLEEEAR